MFDFSKITKLFPFIAKKTIFMYNGKLYTLKKGDYTNVIEMLRKKGAIDQEKDITQITELMNEDDDRN